MNIKFKNTYEVCVLNPSDCDIELRLSDYNTFKEFAKELKSHGIKWDKGEGCFTGRDEDEGLFFVISEKDYGATADWCHPELETYIQENLHKDWFEEDDSVFFAPDLKLEDAFNQLKKIDGVELELVCKIEPGEYVNQYSGPYQYGDAWEQIKQISESVQPKAIQEDETTMSKRTFVVEIDCFEDNCPIGTEPEVTRTPLKKFKTFASFQKWLDDHQMHYDKSYGTFFDNAQEPNQFCWWIFDANNRSEYFLGNLWEHLTKLTGTNWTELIENGYCSEDCDLEAAFNALKQIDGVELEINDDEDYEDRDPHTVEDAQKRGYESYSDFVEQCEKALESNWKEPEEYVDWEAVDKMLRS